MTHAENRIPLYLDRDHDGKHRCAMCGRGTRLVFSFVYPGGLVVGNPRCRRCLTPEQRELLDQFIKPGTRRNPTPYPEHCLSNLRDPGFEEEDESDWDDVEEDWE
jgi:hypothetical protein